MKKYKYNNIEYSLIKDYKNGFENNSVALKLTDYFNDYDYILGDWSYGKLRLKGFCDKTNNNYKSINDKDSIDDYIKNHCSYECRYFILRREK